MPLGLFTAGNTVQNVAPAAGASNNVNPGGGWPSATIGRITVDTTAGACNFTGLVAATTDGQGISLTNTGANNLTLNSQNAGSTAANRFNLVADLVVLPGQTVMLVYFAGAINRWQGVT